MMKGHPVDRGWAWMTVVGAGICMFLVVGGFKTIGILFVEFHKTFEGSAAMTAAFMGLTTCCMSIFAPPVAVIGERYTYRTTVLIGGVLCAVAMFLSAFANSIYFVIFVFGSLTGVSYAFMFAPSLVLLSKYFDKRRSLANGLAMAGASVGQLIIPQVLNFLLTEYNLMWTLIIYSAVCLHAIVAGALLRPVSFYGQRSPSEVKDLKEVPATSKLTSTCTLDGANEVNSPDPVLAAELQDGIKVRRLSEGHASPMNDQEVSQNCRKPNGNPPPLDNKADDIHISDTEATRSCCSRFTSWFYGLYDWSLFTNFLFLAYIVGIMLGNVGYMNPFQLIPPHAKDLGIDKDDTAVLLSIIGGFDLFGRVFGGWFADLGLLKRNNLMALCVIFTGLTLIMYTFFEGYVGLLIFCIVLGLIGGFYISLMAVVCIDFVGLDKFAPAFSLTVLFMGISNTPTPMLLGYIRDVTGSYRGSLMLCGAFMILGGVAFASEPCARRLQQCWDNRKRAKKQQQQQQQQPLPEGDALVKSVPNIDA